MGVDVVDRIRSLSLYRTAFISLVALGVFLLAVLVEVRIVILSPELGDVSSAVRVLVGGVGTLVGLVAGVITIYNFVNRRGATAESGPTDTVHVEGDVHLHLTDPTFSRSRDREEPDADGSSDVDDSDSDEERPTPRD